MASHFADSYEVLLVEDNPGDAYLIQKYLAQIDSPRFDITHRETLSDAMIHVEGQRVDAILLDLSLPDAQGLDSFNTLYPIAKDIPIVILTGLDDQRLAIRAVRNGAQDYLVKADTLQTLVSRSLLYGIERQQSRRKSVELAKTQIRMETLKSFMQDLTHDLKTPLSIVVTSAQLLKYYSDLSNPKIAHHLEIILESCFRLDNMIQNMLEVSKLELQQSIEPQLIESIDLNRFIRNIIVEYQSLTVAKSIDLIHIIETPNVRIESDPILLQRLFDNLITNAINYSPDQSTVTIAVDQHESTVFLTITDNGSGIPSGDLPYIFDRFYRVDKARNSDQGNSGLGLAIVKRIVELHHGEIHVTSEIDVGTTFEITFPALEQYKLDA